MSSINPTITIKPPYTGVRADIPRNMLQEYQAYDMVNFILRNGKFLSRNGYTRFGGDLGARVNGLVSYDHHTQVRRLVASTFTKWYRWNSSTLQWTDITEAGNALDATVGIPQVFRTFYKNSKTYLLGVNGFNDNPVCWDGVTSYYADWAGTPPRAKAMAIIGNRAMLGNIHDGSVRPYTVDVSAFNDFESGWGTTQKVILGDTGGDITAINELGNLSAVIYKTDCIYIATAIAELSPFRFDLKQVGVPGPINPICVVPTNLGHIYLSVDNDVYLFDGYKANQISPAVSSYLSKNMGYSNAQIRQSFGFFNTFNREVWFGFCSKNSDYPDSIIIIKLGDYSVWPLRFDNFYPSIGSINLVEYGSTIGQIESQLGSIEGTIGDFGGTSASDMLGASNGYVYQQGGSKDDGAAISVSIETGLQMPGEGRYVDVLESDHLFTESEQSQLVNVDFGISNSGENPSSYVGVRQMDVGSDGPYVVGHRSVSGRMLSMRLWATVSSQIEWLGSIITGARRGKR